MLNAVQDLIIHVSAFVVVLSLVVFVHEFGHFQVAKWCRVAIDTFSIGFGRSLAAWKDKSGVEWKIGSLPLGGYVKFTDDADPSSALPHQPSPDPAVQAEARRRGLYHAQPVGVRAAVAAAGPAANFIFSIVAFAALLMVFGRDATNELELSPRIDTVQAGSPAERAGVKPGDVVIGINDQRIETWGALRKIVPQSVDQPLRLMVRRGEDVMTITATPEGRKLMDAQGVERTEGVLGVGRQTRPDERKTERLNPLDALGAGAGQVWNIVSSTGAYVGNIFSGRASAEHIAGPLGILSMSGQVAKDASAGPTLGERVENLIAGLLVWAATLSVAVGIVNLLPIPILDGGHLLFYGIEAVRGRPLDTRTQMMGFRAGLALLGSLFLFATWNDLQRLNVLEFLRGMLS